MVVAPLFEKIWDCKKPILINIFLKNPFFLPFSFSFSLVSNGFIVSLSNAFSNPFKNKYLSYPNSAISSKFAPLTFAFLIFSLNSSILSNSSYLFSCADNSLYSPSNFFSCDIKFIFSVSSLVFFIAVCVFFNSCLSLFMYSVSGLVGATLNFPGNKNCLISVVLKSISYFNMG